MRKKKKMKVKIDRVKINHRMSREIKVPVEKTHKDKKRYSRKVKHKNQHTELD